MSLRLILRDDICRGTMGIYLFEEGATARDRRYIAKPSALTFVECPPESMTLPEPWLSISHERIREFFQGFCNEMARLGYRPNTDRDAGELIASKEHLKREQTINDRHLALLDKIISMERL